MPSAKNTTITPDFRHPMNNGEIAGFMQFFFRLHNSTTAETSW
jgi:hypothetical protein